LKKKKSWKVVLSKRDRVLLRDLFYTKGLDLDLLMDNHFKNLHKSTVVKRIQRLVNGHYIDKRAHFNGMALKPLYNITENGLLEVEDYLSGKIIRKELKCSNPVHDLCVAKIYFKLIKSRSLNSLKLENEIQGIDHGDLSEQFDPFKRLNSDIFLSLLIENQEFKVAVEYERSHKDSGRWSEYLLNYHLEENVDVVLYVCDNPTILKGLMRIETELAQRYTQKIYFCLVKEFFKHSSSATFKNISGKTFTLNFHDYDYQQATNALVAKTF